MAPFRQHSPITCASPETNTCPLMYANHNVLSAVGRRRDELDRAGGHVAICTDHSNVQACKQNGGRPHLSYASRLPS